MIFPTVKEFAGIVRLPIWVPPCIDRGVMVVVGNGGSRRKSAAR